MATVPDGELNQHNALTQLLRGMVLNWSIRLSVP